MFSPLPAFGVGATFHAVPLKCSASVRRTPPSTRSPTAQTSPAAFASIPDRSLPCALGLGLLRTFHVVPFQCSTRVRAQEPSYQVPTAQTLLPEIATTS
ncbi:MAG: hypothetical protein ACXVWF_01155 [Actinomycetota bacterium]